MSIKVYRLVTAHSRLSAALTSTTLIVKDVIHEVGEGLRLSSNTLFCDGLESSYLK